MYTVAIYNNKGGVGKSTLTLFMADFLASIHIAGHPLRVLVIDLDAQGSSATALIGKRGLHQAQREERTIGHLALQLAPGQQPDLEYFLCTRAPSKDRKQPLPKVTVLPPERESIFGFDSNPLQQLNLLHKTLKPTLEKRFDIVVLDLPSNVDERHLLAINALIMSDAVIVPVEPSRLSMLAIPSTLRMIRYAQEKSTHGFPKLLGLILNRTDKRSRQFRLHHKNLQELFPKDNLPWFENFLPNAPDLANATDDSLACTSLRDRYGSYYPHVKRVVKELFERWQSHTHGPREENAKTIPLEGL